ncbi:hypothetical protein [Nocardioides sp. GXQ0305]|uniref:hypothetical protein n=1 Tax=Nocardioides sp. GXQ0305 TaxID=3423912 RepID=UPI003D7D946A
MSISERVDLRDVVILRRELLAEGYTDRQIRTRVKCGDLHRVRHGAYVAGDLWRSLGAADRHRVLIRAVLRRAHPSSVVTHLSAAVEHGAPVWGVSLEEVHLTRTDGVPGRREAGVVHHRGVLTEADVEEIDGIRVARPSRCAIEVCSITEVESALVTVNGLLHSRACTAAELAATAGALKHWPDSLTTTIVLRLCDARIESAGESRTSFLCWAQHLPRPTPQVPVVDERGLVFAYADFGWPERGVFLEFDGREKYLRFRRANESLEDFLLREKRREERICQLTGWVCIRITWADLERPVHTARRIHRILESRRSFLGA